MKSITAQLTDISQLKTLEEEIVEQLRQAEEPLTCRMLLDRIPNCPDRETLTREVFLLSRKGMIVRAGEVPAPAGTPRATVACYALPSGSDDARGEQAAPARTAIRDAIAEAIRGIRRESAISKEELIACLPEGNSRTAISGCIKRMASAAQILGAFGSTTARRYYDLRTTDTDLRMENAVCAKSQTIEKPLEVTRPTAVAPIVVAPATVAPIAAPPSLSVALPPAPAEVEFAIYNDGRLAIIDGDEIMVLPPEATRRLGYFLGCLEIHAWPPRLDPVALNDPAALDPEATHL